MTFTVKARVGDKIEISHGEILDRDGNFYNENYRSAWRHVGGWVQYEIDTPIPANIILDGVCKRVPAGHYIF